MIQLRLEVRDELTPMCQLLSHRNCLMRDFVYFCPARRTMEKAHYELGFDK